MILCCGEALIDMLPCRSRENAPAFTPCVGGAAFNTAVALGRQGMAVALFSGLSDDFMGDMLRHTLDASGVDYSLNPRAAAHHPRLRQAGRRSGPLYLLR